MNLARVTEKLAAHTPRDPSDLLVRSRAAVAAFRLANNTESAPPVGSAA